KQHLYQQIMDQMVLLVSTKVLTTGEQIPSIRDMATSLGINPNTVARAYTELEQRGVIDTIPKKGTFVADISLSKEIKAEARSDLAELFSTYRKLGLSAAEIRSLAEEVFSNAENQ
ncbi:MAG: GntR family transcriptional regulator, partial [Eubacteriales bacterium]|nr:GntR family transcriptional regulator [Eubacteriales bacterium]